MANDKQAARREYMRKWHKAHPGYAAEISRRRRQRNPEKFAANKRAAAAKVKADPVRLTKYRAAYRRKAYAYRKETTAAARAWKAAGCLICAESDPVVIEAHHVDPRLKSALVSRLVTGGNMGLLVSELAKCVPLCSNCHTRLHAGQFCLVAAREYHVGAPPRADAESPSAPGQRSMWS